MVYSNWDMGFGIQSFALEPVWPRLPSAHEVLLGTALAEFCCQQHCSKITGI